MLKSSKNLLYSPYEKICDIIGADNFETFSEWKDYKINKLVVRQTLKAKSVKVKKSANKFKYSANLKWSNGKPIVGEIITFKFKGKTYKAKTNKKGIAKITFNKKVLSKLKAGKKYKINVNIKNSYTRFLRALSLSSPQEVIFFACIIFI